MARPAGEGDCVDGPNGPLRSRHDKRGADLFQGDGLTSGAGGGAQLSLAEALPVVAPRRRLSSIDLAPDLGEAIGSRRWWRGMGTLTGLIAAVWALSPGIRPVLAQTPVGGERTVSALSAQAITPLALGADTGRRMGATAAVRPLADTPERPRIELSATLGRSDSFSRVLERAGVGGREADRAARLVAQAFDVGAIKPGTRMDLVLGRRARASEPRPLERLFFRADLGLALSVQRSTSGLELVRTDVPIDATPLRVSGTVGDSLYRAARAAGVPADAVQTALRAFGDRSIGSSDRFDLVVGQRRAATGEVEQGELLLAAIWRDGRPTQLIRWTVDGREGWYDAAALTRPRGQFVQPVQGYQSSGYGLRRHPILGYTRMHAGVDFAAPYGSPIRAASDGVVSFAGWHGGHGRYIRLGHSNGLGTGYGHMSRIAVSPGTRVRAGQVIGYVGSTGLSTGPHLHYEVYRGGVTVNPNSVSFISRPTVDANELARFHSRVRELLGQ